MSPTPTDVCSDSIIAGNLQQATTTTTALAPPVKDEPPLSSTESTALGEDTSSVSSHGAPSPRPGSTEPSPPGRQSLRPPVISTTAAATGQHKSGSDGAGAGNLPSGISVQELKKATALRMASQQQQAHLRVASPFSYGKKAERVCVRHIHGGGRSSRERKSKR